MSVRPLEIVPEPDAGAGADVLEHLRGRIQALQGAPTRLSIPTLPLFDGLVQLRAGGVYGVDAAGLAMSLAAGASQQGEWVGFAGWRDFGAEAAHQRGVDLSRTVLVPAPGEHWVEVAAALIDVLRVVVLRPPGAVDAKTAGILQARLRARSAVLLVQGDWPRCDARLVTEQVEWVGVDAGRGRLREQRLRLLASSAGRPPARSGVVVGEQGP
ncbi:MAG: hypothetical protein L0H31_02640 [Nocardioidaceae bacterium]|nr:hypothetical protein [Nocardioidaceae bacterium]